MTRQVGYSINPTLSKVKSLSLNPEAFSLCRVCGGLSIVSVQNSSHDRIMIGTLMMIHMPSFPSCSRVCRADSKNSCCSFGES